MENQQTALFYMPVIFYLVLTLIVYIFLMKTLFNDELIILFFEFSINLFLIPNTDDLQFPISWKG